MCCAMLFAVCLWLRQAWLQHEVGMLLNTTDHNVCGGVMTNRACLVAATGQMLTAAVRGGCVVQVEVAKKIMFEQQKEDPLPRRNNRRETWCPGRSAWAPPLAGECCRCRSSRPDLQPSSKTAQAAAVCNLTCLQPTLSMLSCVPACLQRRPTASARCKPSARWMRTPSPCSCLPLGRRRSASSSLPARAHATAWLQVRCHACSGIIVWTQHVQGMSVQVLIEGAASNSVRSHPKRQRVCSTHSRSAHYPPQTNCLQSRRACARPKTS